MSFLVEPQNQGRWSVIGLTSNLSSGFSRFCLKTDGDDFLGLASKPWVTFSWFQPQNQADFGLSVAPEN
jgi:hypothetical protein